MLASLLFETFVKTLMWEEYHEGRRQAPPCHVEGCYDPSIWIGDGCGQCCDKHD